MRPSAPDLLDDVVKDQALHDLVALYQAWGKQAEVAKYQAVRAAAAERKRSATLSP
jgi:hypothetical protein